MLQHLLIVIGNLIFYKDWAVLRQLVDSLWLVKGTFGPASQIRPKYRAQYRANNVKYRADIGLAQRKYRAQYRANAVKI